MTTSLVDCFAAARTRLRKMKAEEAAKAETAASDASKPVERSPHAKEVSGLLLFGIICACLVNSL